MLYIELQAKSDVFETMKEIGKGLSDLGILDEAVFILVDCNVYGMEIKNKEVNYPLAETFLKLYVTRNDPIGKIVEILRQFGNVGVVRMDVFFEKKK